MRYKTRLLRYFATIIGILAFSLLGTTKNLFAASISSFGVSSPTVNLELSPSIGSSSSSTGSHTATITTDCASGYKIYVSMAKPSGSNEVDNYLHLNGSTEESILGSNAIGPTSGSISSPAALSTNSWGVKIGDSNTFGAVPAYSEIKRYSNEISANPPALISSSSAAATGQDHIVTYGANATTDLVAGYYQGAILYTTIMDSACYTSTITIEKDDHVASTSGITSGNSYPVGSAQSVTCTPETGYSCGWYINNIRVSEGDTYNFTVPNHNLTLTAKSNINSYNLTLVNENEPAISEITGGGSKPYGSTVTVTCIARTAYHCTGWTSSDSSVADSTEASYTFTMPAKDITLTADGAENTYNIELRPNGGNLGGGTFPNVSYFTNVDFGEKGPFGRPGYSLLGWSHSADATTATYAPDRWDSTSEIIDNAGQIDNHGATIILYAVWRPNTYTINIDKNGGSDCMFTTYENVKYTDNFYVNPCLRDGYKFLGYAHQSTATTPDYIYAIDVDHYAASTVVDAAGKQNNDGATIQLYAVWANDTYLVSAYDDGDDGDYVDIYLAHQSEHDNDDYCDDSEDAHCFFAAGEKVYIDVGWLTQGADFVSWRVETTSGTAISVNSSTSSTTYFTMPHENVIVYANTTPHTYTVHFNGCSNTGGTMNNQSFTYKVSQRLSTNAFTRSQYEFAGWSKDSCSGTATYSDGQNVSTLTSTNGATVNLYAIWKPIAYAYNDAAEGDLIDVYITTQNSYNNNVWDAQGKSASLAFNQGDKVYIQAGWLATGLGPSSWQVTGRTSGNSYSVTTTSNTYIAYFTMPSEPVLIKGITTTKTYFVKFNGCSNTGGSMSNQTFTYNESKRLSSNSFTRDGYEFEGWNKTGCYLSEVGDDHVYFEDKAYASGLSNTHGAVVNVYAVWKPIAYAYDDDDDGDYVDIYLAHQSEYDNGEWCEEGTEARCASLVGERVYFYAGWVRNGYRVTNFRVVKMHSGTTVEIKTDGMDYFIMPNEPVVIYADTAQYSYTVKFNGCSNTSGSMSNQIIGIGVEQELRTNAFVRTGYVFEGWSTTSCSGSKVYSNKQKVKNLSTTNGATVNLYAVWRHESITDKAYMQDVTPTICNNSSIGEEKTMKDRRTNISYTVVKLDDGRCWELEGLRINNKTLTPSDSDVSENFTLPDHFAVQADFTQGNGEKYAEVYDPTTNYGYLYNFYAATAGKGRNGSSANATSSICPKNWSLPNRATNNQLASEYPTKSNILADAGFNVWGWLDKGKGGNPNIKGFWSKESSSSNGAYAFWIEGADTDLVKPERVTEKQDGISVICVVNIQ